MDVAGVLTEKNTNKLSFRNEKLEYLVILNVQGYGQAVPLVFFPKLIDWLAVAMPYVMYNPVW